MERARDAVILMAGIGSRLGMEAGVIAKPLVPIGGRPLIAYTFDALLEAGVRNVHAVMGATSARLTAELLPLVPKRMQLHPIVNHEWQKQNGVSVLAAAGHVQAPFFLTMGDHLFEPAILDLLLAGGKREGAHLAVDRKIARIFDLPDATKVATDGELIREIGKELCAYDAIDTGVFLCGTEIFTYLGKALRNGDCSLSDGIRLMAAAEKVRAIDIGEAWWQDVDTPEMLERAEQDSARLLRQSRGGLAQERVRCER
ncbi:MAG: NTP transferase domain-containing protein [Chthoniobacterales bacterium]